MKKPQRGAKRSAGPKVQPGPPPQADQSPRPRDTAVSYLPPVKPGPPPRYKPEFAEKALQAAQVGYTVSEIARLLDVHVDVVNLWIMVYPAFAAAMKANMQARTDRVEAALYQRAVGFRFQSERIINDKGRILRVVVWEEVIPDVKAQEVWLNAHRGDVYGAKNGGEDGEEPDVFRLRIVNDPDAEKPDPLKEYEIKKSDA